QSDGLLDRHRLRGELVDGGHHPRGRHFGRSQRFDVVAMATTLINAFQFPVAIDRSLGQLKQQRDYPTYVGQLVKQVLLTNPGERAHRPDFGAGLLGMVFAPNDDATASLLQTTILQGLNAWLGSIISVNDVLVR